MSFFDLPKGRWLTRRFGARINVTISPDAVAFRKGRVEIRLEPILYARDGIVVSVGRAPGGKAEALPVFTDDRAARQWRLDRLVVYAFSELSGSMIAPRPNCSVRVHGVSIEAEEVRRAFERAGAADVTVDG
jgi:hypothetical protein